MIQNEDMVKVEQKAYIDWLNEDGTVRESERSFRGMIPLCKLLSEKLSHTPAIAKTKISIYLKVEDNDNKMIISEGTVEEVLVKLKKRIIPAPLALAELQRVMSTMSEFTDLKGVILTAVFGEAQAAGFGFLTSSDEFNEQDLNVLVSAASGQVDLFKNSMRKKFNMQFEGDSKIIPATTMPPRFK